MLARTKICVRNHNYSKNLLVHRNNTSATDETIKVWCTHGWAKILRRKPNLKVIFVPFFTYVELRVHTQQHKHTTNITTMVVELLAPPAACI